MDAQNLSIFQFNQSPIRIEILNNEPLFCLTDVASVLEISNANPSRFKLSEAGVHKMYIRSSGQKRELVFINEPNLYRVIFRSNKPQAINFQNWVFDEVLPQIRKTGKYETPSDRMTDEQVGYIYNSVMRICGETGQTYQALFGMLKREFQVASYKHIKAVDFPHACEVLGVPVPVFTSRAQQAIEHQEHYGYLNEIDAWNTINLWFRLKNLSEFMQDHMLPVLKKLDSGLFGRAYSLTHDPIMTLTLTEDCLLDLSKQFQQLDNKGMDWNERVSNIKNCTFKRLT